MPTKHINITEIRTDGGTQIRVELDTDLISEYRDAVEAGDTFPAVDVFHDGSTYWLADGFHRFFAFKRAGKDSIPATVHQGTKEDAIVFACAANQTHGHRRNRADVAAAIVKMLEIRPKMTSNEVAKHVGCDHKTVEAHRKPILGNSQDTREATRNGKTYTMDTSNIGRKPQAETTREKTVEYVDTDTGEVLDNVEAVTTTESVKREQSSRPEQRGRGVEIALKAVAILQTIPSDDGLRSEAFDLVQNWLKQNRN